MWEGVYDVIGRAFMDACENIDAIFLIHNMRVGKRKKNKEHMV